MRVTKVVWDAINTQFFLDAGLTTGEVNEILYDPQNSTVIRKAATGEIKITYGWTSSGHRLGIVWEPVCGNPLMISPVDYFHVRSGERTDDEP